MQRYRTTRNGVVTQSDEQAAAGNTPYLALAKSLTGSRLTRRAFVFRETPTLLGTAKCIDYVEFHRLIVEIACGLIALGIGPGSTVAVSAGDCPEQEALFFAANLLGARFVCMARDTSPENLAFVLSDADVQILFTEAKIADGLRPHLEHSRVQFVLLPHEKQRRVYAVGWPGFRQIARSVTATPKVACDAEAVAVIVYTSGTTGQPKGAIHTNRSLMANISALRERYPDISKERLLVILPGEHIYSRICERLLMLLVGAELHLIRDHSNRSALAKYLLLLGPTVVFGVPTLYQRLAQRFSTPLVGKLVKRLFLRRLKVCISGGAALVVGVIKTIGEFVVRNGYGSTEMGVVCTEGPNSDQCALGSVGRPLRGFRVVVDRSTWHDPEHPEYGELVVYGPSIMTGYQNLPEETARVLTPDGGYRTGDIGYVDELGFVYVIDRLKDQFKAPNGKWVVPWQYEYVLGKYPGVEQAFIDFDSRRREVYAVVVVNGRNAESITELQRKLLAYVHEVAANPAAGLSQDGFPRQPVLFLVSSEPFSVADGTMTRSLKLRRPEIRRKYQAMLSAPTAANA